MPTLKPASFASLIVVAARAFDGEGLAANFDLQEDHARYLYDSLPPGEHSPDYVR